MLISLKISIAFWTSVARILLFFVGSYKTYCASSIFSSIGKIVKSSIAFYTLLNESIGDTIRVSLSAPEENEVVAGLNILKECGKRAGGIKLVSCPRCGRIGFDVHSFVDRWQNKLLSMNKDITVAVMGCVVNGPGEGRHADLGIAGTKDKVIIFKKGKIVQTVDAKDADKVFEEELNSL